MIIPVISIMVHAREKASGDPRDKVFALHSVFEELGAHLPLPDYTKTVEEVYRDSVVASINFDNMLKILFYVPSDHRRDDLASWVPDWSDSGWQDTDLRHAAIYDRFAASSDSNPKWRFSKDQRSLVVTGKIVDTIIYRAEPIPSYGITKENINDETVDKDVILEDTHKCYTVFRSWVEISQWSQYPTGESTKEALQRTIVNDEPKCNADAASGESFEAWYKFMNASDMEVTKMVALKIGSAPDDPFLQQIPDPVRIFSAMGTGSRFSFNSQARMISDRKCFFYTDKRYFGTAPDPVPTPVESGDCIALVGGLEMPLLLRPVEGGYRLLCHVYVHGMMYGEAWPENAQDLDEIVLI
jgi:hypothetical protein